MSDRKTSEERHANVGVPDEPPPDDFEWTAEPEAPDVAGMPGEYVDEPGEGVPGVRRDPDATPDPSGADPQRTSVAEERSIFD